MLGEAGPILLAANHPNSFLDAIILASLFKSPVYSLARGDVFAGKCISKILASLKMLPVYRISEGTENLETNYVTFNACQKLFKENKIVLIFSEGRSTNEWRLRHLKKGTARLALEAWNNDIPLRVLPLGINYSSFRSFGKNVFINFGTFISKDDFQSQPSSGKSIVSFNTLLKQQLVNLVFKAEKNDKELVTRYFYIHQSLLKKAILFLPAIVGAILGFPLYFIIHLAIKNKANDHYDSVMVGLLFFIYPLYIFLITALVWIFSGHWFSIFLTILLPFCSWSFLQLKKQID